MKNGAPSNAVIIPIGISAGATTQRATQSATTRTPAPNSIANGIKREIGAPTSILAIWGITKPIKPIMPVNATAPPTPSATQIIYFSLQSGVIQRQV